MNLIGSPKWYRSRLTLISVILSVWFSACHGDGEPTGLQVTNGRIEDGFSYVVQLRMESGGSCTGSLVSDSLLITAAHCVDKTNAITVGAHRATSDNFHIHPGWPSLQNNWQGQRLPRFDLALVQFAPGSFYEVLQVASEGNSAGSFALLASRAPQVDELIKIVGYGNSEITPFTTYCRMRRQPSEDGRCRIERGQRLSGARYEYQLLMEYTADETHLPAQCTNVGLRESLAQADTTFDDFVATYCEGNLRDRPYRESGVGYRRSGENQVSRLEPGVIIFSGLLGGPGTGEEAASGAGDSGGPLFINEDGRWRLAGITHGGNLTEVELGMDQEQGRGLSKRSIYVDLHDSLNFEWLLITVQQHQLDFPGLNGWPDLW